MAVAFGPNTRNFRAVVESLLQRDAAVVVNDGYELTRFVERCLADRSYAEQLGARAAGLVEENRGAAARTTQLLGQLITADDQPPQDRKSAA